MSRNNAISQSDRVLFGVLAIILATASVAVGAGMTWRPVRPSTEQIAVKPAEPDLALDRLVADHRCLAEALTTRRGARAARASRRSPRWCFTA